MPLLQDIDPIPSREVSTRDLLLAALSDLGCGVSGMSGVLDADAEEIGSVDYSGGWELFCPDEIGSVAEAVALPHHWRCVLVLHWERHRDCRGARYVHAPDEILASYPRVPVRGIFQVWPASVEPGDIQGKHLTHTLGEDRTAYTEITDDDGAFERWAVDWFGEVEDDEAGAA